MYKCWCATKIGAWPLQTVYATRNWSSIVVCRLVEDMATWRDCMQTHMVLYHGPYWICVLWASYSVSISTRLPAHLSWLMLVLTRWRLKNRNHKAQVALSHTRLTQTHHVVVTKPTPSPSFFCNKHLLISFITAGGVVNLVATRSLNTWFSKGFVTADVLIATSRWHTCPMSLLPGTWSHDVYLAGFSFANMCCKFTRIALASCSPFLVVFPVFHNVACEHSN